MQIKSVKISHKNMDYDMGKMLKQRRQQPALFFTDT